MESCHTCECVKSHVWMNHVTLPTRHTQEIPRQGCNLHSTTSHVTHMNEFRDRYDGVMSHIWMSPATGTMESCRTYEWIMSHIWMSHVTHMNESCHTYEWTQPKYKTQAILMQATRLYYKYKQLNRDLYIPKYKMQAIPMQAISTWRYITSRIKMSHATYLIVSHIWMSHVTHMNESRHVYDGVTSHK